MDAPRTSRARVAWPLAAALACSAAGCGSDAERPTEPDPPRVASVTVAPDVVTFHELEATRRLTATARDDSGNIVSGVGFAWTSSDPSVASVDGEGLVTGRSNGSATVRAEADGVRGSAQVAVEQRIALVAVTPADAILAGAGASLQLQAEPRDANGHPVAGAGVAWSSTDPLVVSIDASGLATAMSAGQAAIRASVGVARGYADLTVDGDAAGPPPWFWIDTGLIQGCGLTSTLELYCWGDNDHGQMGIPASEAFPSPVVIPTDLRFDRIVAGGGQVCALTPVGEAYCWGNTSFGEGGFGSTAYEHTTPTAVHGDLVFATLIAGGNHTCGLTEEGLAYCWGLNDHGQLGDGTAENGLTPRRVSGERTYTDIALARPAANNHSCAVTTAGEGYCWGRNEAGELGDGTTEDRTTPVRVGLEVPIARIAAGGAHSCALTPEGEAWCWGSNVGGVLGDGTDTDRLAPVRVDTEASFTSIIAGEQHTCGLTSEGAALCWGQNADGELGDGTNLRRSTPVEVSGGHGFARISAGSRFTCGLTTDGRVYCWGGNEDFALGIGAPGGVNVPTPVLRPDEGG